MKRSARRLLRQHVSSWFRQNSPSIPFSALQHVSFHLARVASLGIVGSNGAGKSTLLSIISGLTRPDSGSVVVEGTIAPLLELGSGFHPDLTGAENIELNASLLGFTQKETERLFDAIVEFSGIPDFIDEPLRTYSAGMSMRLAFSVAVNLEPDLLVVDEVIAVGDQEFQAKCFDRISRFRRSGGSLICASHSPDLLVHLCDRGLWLDHGQAMLTGEIGTVLEAYQGRLAV
jgi:ABC-type polysaccharide/polyol phosphate transport system ATPase subunit